MGNSKNWLKARARNKQLIEKAKRIAAGALISAVIVGPLIYFGAVAVPIELRNARKTGEQTVPDLPATPEVAIEIPSTPQVKISNKPIEFPEKKKEKEELINPKVEFELKDIPKVKQQKEEVTTAFLENTDEAFNETIIAEFRDEDKNVEIRTTKKETEGQEEKLIVMQNLDIDDGPRKVEKKEDADTVARAALRRYLKTNPKEADFDIYKDTSKLKNSKKTYQLVVNDIKTNNEKWYVTFQQYKEALPVFDGNVKMIFTERKQLLTLTDNLRTDLPDATDFIISNISATETTKEIFDWDDKEDKIDFINKGYYKNKTAFKVDVDSHNPLGEYEVYVNGADGSIENVTGDIRLADETGFSAEELLPNSELPYNPATDIVDPTLNEVGERANEETLMLQDENPIPLSEEELEIQRNSILEKIEAEEDSIKNENELKRLQDDAIREQHEAEMFGKVEIARSEIFEKIIAPVYAEDVFDIPSQDVKGPSIEILEEFAATSNVAATPDASSTPEPGIVVLDTIFSQVLGKIYPQNPNQAPVVTPLKNAFVYYNSTQYTTDEDGYFENKDGDWYSVFLDGPYVTVYDDDASANADIKDRTPEDPFVWDENSASLAAINAFYHANEMHDYFVEMQDYEVNKKIPITVNSELVDQYLNGCGAWFNNSDKSIEMGRGGTTSCPEDLNYALSSDFVYHEYTHFIIEEITHLPNIAGSEAAAMGEGLADYFAASKNNDSVWGDVVAPNDTRNLKNILQYEINMTGESHHDGQIFAGALWDLRTLIGPIEADRLIFNTLYQDRLHFETFMYGLLIEDDDNNDFSDGTPHMLEIIAAFENHGIGPGILNFEGLPVAPEAWTELVGEEAPAGDEDNILNGINAGCSGYDNGTAILIQANVTCTWTGSGSRSSVYLSDGADLYVGSSTATGTLNVSGDVLMYGTSSRPTLNIGYYDAYYGRMLVGDELILSNGVWVRVAYDGFNYANSATHLLVRGSTQIYQSSTSYTNTNYIQIMDDANNSTYSGNEIEHNLGNLFVGRSDTSTSENGTNCYVYISDTGRVNVKSFRLDDDGYINNYRTFYNYNAASDILNGAYFRNQDTLGTFYMNGSTLYIWDDSYFINDDYVDSNITWDFRDTAYLQQSSTASTNGSSAAFANTSYLDMNGGDFNVSTVTFNTTSTLTEGSLDQDGGTFNPTTATFNNYAYSKVNSGTFTPTTAYYNNTSLMSIYTGAAATVSTVNMTTSAGWNHYGGTNSITTFNLEDNTWARANTSGQTFNATTINLYDNAQLLKTYASTASNGDGNITAAIINIYNTADVLNQRATGSIAASNAIVVANDARFYQTAGNTTTGNAFAQGTNQTTNSGELRVDGGKFDASGGIYVRENGWIDLNGGEIEAGTLTVNDTGSGGTYSAWVDMDGGTLDIIGTTTLNYSSQIDKDGGTTTIGTLTMTNDAEYNQNGTGNTTVYATATLDQGAEINVNASTFSISADLDLNSGTSTSNNSWVYVASGATMDINDDVFMDENYVQIDNDGTFYIGDLLKMDGSSTATGIVPYINNSYIMRVGDNPSGTDGRGIVIDTTGNIVNDTGDLFYVYDDIRMGGEDNGSGHIENYGDFGVGMSASYGGGIWTAISGMADNEIVMNRSSYITNYETGDFRVDPTTTSDNDDGVIIIYSWSDADYSTFENRGELRTTAINIGQSAFTSASQCTTGYAGGKFYNHPNSYLSVTGTSGPTVEIFNGEFYNTTNTATNLDINNGGSVYIDGKTGSGNQGHWYNDGQSDIGTMVVMGCGDLTQSSDTMTVSSLQVYGNSYQYWNGTININGGVLNAIGLLVGNGTIDPGKVIIDGGKSLNTVLTVYEDDYYATSDEDDYEVYLTNNTSSLLHVTGTLNLGSVTYDGGEILNYAGDGVEESVDTTDEGILAGTTNIYANGNIYNGGLRDGTTRGNRYAEYNWTTNYNYTINFTGASSQYDNWGVVGASEINVPNTVTGAVFNNKTNTEDIEGGWVGRRGMVGTYSDTAIIFYKGTFNNNAKNTTYYAAVNSTSIEMYESAIFNNNGGINTDNLWIGYGYPGYGGTAIDGGTFNNNQYGVVYVRDLASDAALVYAGDLNINQNSNTFLVYNRMTVTGFETLVSSEPAYVTIDGGTDQNVANAVTLGELKMYGYAVFATNDDVVITQSFGGNGELYIGEYDGGGGSVGAVLGVQESSQVSAFVTFSVTGKAIIDNLGQMLIYAERGLTLGVGGLVAVDAVTVNSGGWLIADTDSQVYFQNGLYTEGNVYLQDNVEAVANTISGFAIETAGGITSLGTGGNTGTAVSADIKVHSGSTFVTYEDLDMIGNFTATDEYTVVKFKNSQAPVACNTDIDGDLFVYDNARVYVDCLTKPAVKVHAGSPGGLTQVTGTLILNTNLETDDMIIGSDFATGLVTHDLMGSDTLYLPSGGITNIVDLTGETQVTTSSAHNLVSGDIVTISGTTNYNGTWIIENATLGGTTFTINTTGFATESSGSWIQVINPASAATVFDLNVLNNLYIGSGSSMDVSGKSNYLTNESGGGTFGGTYGGKGQSTSLTGVKEYGYSTSLFDTTLYGLYHPDFGSAGVYDAGVGLTEQARGGGKMKIKVGGNLDNDGGSILANGFSGDTYSYEASGSGGAIMIWVGDDTALTGSLSGDGNIEAKGGSTTSLNSGFGGGGGRIYIDYIDMSSYTGDITAEGGNSSIEILAPIYYRSSAAPGSVFYRWRDFWENQRRGTLVIKGDDTYPIDILSNSTYDNNDAFTFPDGSNAGHTVFADEQAASINIDSLQIEDKGAFWPRTSCVSGCAKVQQCIKETGALDYFATNTYEIEYNSEHSVPAVRTACYATPDPPQSLVINDSSIGTSGGTVQPSDKNNVATIADITPDINAVHIDGVLDSDNTMIDYDNASHVQIQVAEALDDLWMDTTTNYTCNIDDLSLGTQVAINNNFNADVVFPDSSCITNLEGGKSYYWRIRLKDSYIGLQGWGLWSETGQLDVEEGGTIGLDMCENSPTNTFDIGTFDTETGAKFRETWCQFITDATVGVQLFLEKDQALTNSTDPNAQIWDMESDDLDDDINIITTRYVIDGESKTALDYVNEFGYWLDESSADLAPAIDPDFTLFTYSSDGYMEIETTPIQNLFAIGASSYSNQTFKLWLGAYMHGLLTDPTSPETNAPTDYCGTNTIGYSNVAPCITKDGNYEAVLTTTIAPIP